MKHTLDLRVKPNWQEIDTVRERAVAFLKQQGISADVVDAVAMAACELTENANKYGEFGPVSSEITVKVGVTSTAITIEVRNPIPQASSANLANLDRMVQWIRGFQDPFEAYVERLKVVSAQSLQSRESGLGLVRIAYEGQSIVDFCVEDQSILAVSAVHPL